MADDDTTTTALPRSVQRAQFAGINIAHPGYHRINQTQVHTTDDGEVLGDTHVVDVPIPWGRIDRVSSPNMVSDRLHNSKRPTGVDEVESFARMKYPQSYPFFRPQFVGDLPLEVHRRVSSTAQPGPAAAAPSVTQPRDITPVSPPAPRPSMPTGPIDLPSSPALVRGSDPAEIGDQMTLLRPATEAETSRNAGQLTLFPASAVSRAGAKPRSRPGATGKPQGRRQP